MAENTTEGTNVRRRRFEAWRYLIGVLIGIASTLPLISTYFEKSPYFISSEFIGYRVGHSIMLQSGESDYVRPVQGISTAILSNAILAATRGPGTERGIGRADLDHYARVFGTIVALIVISLSICAWVSLPVIEAAIVSLFLVAPWYVGVASMALFLSPDYWLGEWVWLAGTLLILARSRSRGLPLKNSPLAAGFLLGAWAAVGASTKISLLGAAPILLLVVLSNSTPRRTIHGLVCFIAGVLLVYPIVLMFYMGSVGQGLALLKFHINFFQFPNNSAEYSSWREAIKHKPETGIYMGAALGLSYMALIVAGARRMMSWASIAGTLVITAWLLSYLLMLARRPHDSTLTSICLSALFMIAFSVLLFPEASRAIALSLTAALLAGAAVSTHFPGKAELSAIWNTNYEDIKVSDSFLEMANRCQYAIWFVPINEWNAALPPELLGYNGGLGHHAVYYASGHLSYNRKAAAFQRLWPNTFLMGADAADFINIGLAVHDGATVFYTKPVDSPNPWVQGEYKRLVNCLHDANCDVVEVPVVLKGQHWIFGHSTATK